MKYLSATKRTTIGDSSLKNYKLHADPQFHFEGDPADSNFVSSIVKSGVQACVCANDMTAANLMHTLDSLGVRIPEDLRIVGIDDVRYASLLRVPLTTIHQPCKHIGMSAVTAMMERIANPDMPARDILVDFKLVVRESCGAA
jgi:DNA-binding LacI/PurR family transcriptional regulator